MGNAATTIVIAAAAAVSLFAGCTHHQAQDTALGRDEEALFVWADAEGIGEFARAVERNPIDAAAWAKLGIMFLGGGSHVQGLQCYQRAAALAPDNAEYQYFRAWLLAADDRLEESLAVFEIALALDPGNAAFYDKLGWVLGGAGRFEASMAAFERAAALDPDSQPSFDRARILMQFDRFAEALAALEILIGKGATIRSVFRERGWCLHHLGRYDEALAAYDRAASFNAYGKPIEPWSMGCVDKVRFYRAQTLAVLGRYAEALEEIDCFIEARPGFPGAEEIRREILAKLDGRRPRSRGPEFWNKTGYARIVREPGKLLKAGWEASADDPDLFGTAPAHTDEVSASGSRLDGAVRRVCLGRSDDAPAGGPGHPGLAGRHLAG